MKSVELNTSVKSQRVIIGNFIIMLRKLSKLRRFVPNELRYSHLIRSSIMWFRYFSGKIRGIDNKDYSISNNYLSLSVGVPYKFRKPSDNNVIWRSSNPLVSVSSEGVALALQNAIGENSHAVITAIDDKGSVICNYQVTIVNWTANKSRLEITGRLPGYHILACKDKAIYFCVGKKLFKTKDGFFSKKIITKLPFLPAPNYPMLITPYGYFLIGEKTIIHSKDLCKWNRVCALQMHGNINMFDYYYDEQSEICFVFAGEYSCDPGRNHKVYRGIVRKDLPQKWDIVLDFESITSYRNTKSIRNSARHIHVVAIDPFSGTLWVGTGDEDVHSKVMYSTDFGNSFQILGLGSQEWRTLSIWFTQNYIYWNMDSYEPQKIFRINRKELAINNLTCTPRLAEGKTQIGLKYLVEKRTDTNRFPVEAGIAYIETAERELDNDNFVIALNDKRYDFREVVAILDNGAQFNYCWAKTSDIEDIVIMGASPEGNIRDMLGRVFGIKENLDGSTNVQELILLAPKNAKANYNINMFTQLVPICQYTNGEIYFKSRNLKWPGLYKAKLIWNN